MAELLYEVSALVGSAKNNPIEWRGVLLTPIHKKGATDDTRNYRPLCMLSCIRKII